MSPIRHLLPTGSALALMLALAACGGTTGVGHDAGQHDGGPHTGPSEAGPQRDAAGDAAVDAVGDGAGGDAAGDGPGGDGAAGDAADAGGDAAGDAGADAMVDAPPQQDAQHDAAPQQDAQHDTAPQQDAGTWHVDIYISNTCQVTVVPTSITVPAGSSLMLDFHNNSQDYNADIWWSWAGGYLDLATGAIWHDPIPACSMTSVHDEYADISPAGSPSACGEFRLWIHCV